jgi:hypothetical protein
MAVSPFDPVQGGVFVVQQRNEALVHGRVACDATSAERETVEIYVGRGVAIHIRRSVAQKCTRR